MNYNEDDKMVYQVRNDAEIKISREDFGTLCICALRYCHGRRTYMPSLVQEIVSDHFADLDKKALTVIANDERFQKDMERWGDNCDKVDWQNFYRGLEQFRASLEQAEKWKAVTALQEHFGASKKMTKEDAFYIVYKDLTEKESIFTGRYDAKNGSKEYMHGVCSVMEYISYMVGEDCYDAFNDRFIKNMIESEEKAERGE